MCIRDSPYTSPIVAIPKKNGQVRLCLDAREINKMIINDRTSPGEIEEILKRFHGTSTLVPGIRCAGTGRWNYIHRVASIWPVSYTHLGINKNIEELKEDNRSTKEELGHKIENTNKRIEETSKKIESDNQQLKEELRENNRKLEEKMGERLEELREDNQLLREELREANHCLLYTSRCV